MEQHTRQKETVTISSSSSTTDTGTSNNSEDPAEQMLCDQEGNNTEEVVRPKSNAKKMAKNAADDKGPRLVVDNDHVATLVWDYRKYFAEFSRGRKKKTKQLIPNKVWTNVHSDYKKQFPRSAFRQAFRPESLKIHLREALNDLHLGVNNPEAENQQGGTELQDDEEMRTLYNIDGFLRRNVLQVRQRSMEGNDSGKWKEAPKAAPPMSHSMPVPSTPQSEKAKSAKRPFTEKEALQQVGEDIASMLSEVKSIKEKQADGASKQVGEEARREEAAARREEAAARQEESTARLQETHFRKVFKTNKTLWLRLAFLKAKRFGIDQ